ncbi:MAG: DMT family transporter [Peptostreptococcaceae bacterium]|nr:DMT family transporter [Peptostreptococcaceae bacterium]
MNQTNEKKPFLDKYVKGIVVLGVLAGSTSGIFGAVIEAPALAMGFWRLLIATPFFAIPVIRHQKAELLSISKKDLALTFLAGFFLFGHFFFWFNAVKITNVPSAVVLAALHPLIVLIVSIFVWHRKVTYKAIIAIVVALLGCTVIAGLDYAQLTQGAFLGDIFAFLAGGFMGIYLLIGDMARKRVSGRPYVFLVFLSCWICFIVGIILTNTPVLGYSKMDYIYLVAYAIVCQIGAHAVFNLCMGHVDALYISTWESSEAVFAIVLSVIFLNQIPTYWQIIGCLMVVGALLYYNREIAK